MHRGKVGIGEFDHGGLARAMAATHELAMRYGGVPQARSAWGIRRDSPRETTVQPLSKLRTSMRIRPEHIHVALREPAGISDHAYSTQFPFKVKADDKPAGLWG
jgi:hypothetical protein